MKITKDVAVIAFRLRTKMLLEKVFAARMKEVQFVGDIVRSINLNIEREANMKDEHIAQMAKELKEVFGWMQDSSAVNADTLDELIEDSGDIYEVILDIHLKNGDVVSLNNDCIGGFEKKQYTGAYLDCDFSDGNIIAAIYEYSPKYHSIRIPLTSICWIDSHTENIDWKEYKLKKENSGKINKGNE